MKNNNKVHPIFGEILHNFTKKYEVKNTVCPKCGKEYTRIKSKNGDYCFHCWHIFK